MNKLRATALAISVPFLLYGLIFLFTEKDDEFFSTGTIQHAHQDLVCADCHVESKGTVRQQIQANVKYALGKREHPADFGFQDVTSVQCLTCHERPNDRHPIYRFREPRFVDAIAEIDATSCLGCHSEHVNEKVSTGIEFCSACHQELEVKDDPIDVAHTQLIENEQWNTCLGCHDFHGNHRRETQVNVDDRFLDGDIKDYFAAGKSPYGNDLFYEAEDNDNK